MRSFWEKLIFFILGITATLIIQGVSQGEINKTLHRKLFQEIVSNQKQAMIMEISGKFKEFETTAWDNFCGTPAFYKVPMDTRRPLDTYYTLLKWYNKDLFKWKALIDKTEWEMKTEQMNKLTEDYIKFLIVKKILDPKDFKDVEYSKSEKDLKGMPFEGK